MALADAQAKSADLASREAELTKARVNLKKAKSRVRTAQWGGGRQDKQGSVGTCRNYLGLGLLDTVLL